MSAHAAPPTLPEVTDEAPETASWMPWLGFALVLLAAFYASMGGTKSESAPGSGSASETAAPEHGEPAAHP